MGICKNNIATVQSFFQREECIGVGVGPFVGYLLAHHGAYVILGQYALFFHLCHLSSLLLGLQRVR